MLRSFPFVALLIAAACLLIFNHSTDAQSRGAPTPLPPGFQPAPEVPAMPKALMKLPRTDIHRAKFPAIDFHLHGRSLRTDDDYRKMIQLMDYNNIAMICNMDGGYG